MTICGKNIFKMKYKKKNRRKNYNVKMDEWKFTVTLYHKNQHLFQGNFCFALLEVSSFLFSARLWDQNFKFSVSFYENVLKEAEQKYLLMRTTINPKISISYRKHFPAFNQSRFSTLHNFTTTFPWLWNCSFSTIHFILTP